MQKRLTAETIHDTIKAGDKKEIEKYLSSEGQTIEIAGVKITGIEAYTKRGFHIKGEGCGFLIEFRPT